MRSWARVGFWGGSPGGFLGLGPGVYIAWNDLSLGGSEARVAEVVARAAIPVGGGRHLGQVVGLRLVRDELAVVEHADVRRVRVEQGELNPAVADQLADTGVAVHDPQDRLGSRFDDEEDADR